MSYKITIEQSKTIIVQERGEYRQVGTEYISDKVYKNLSYEDQKRYKAVEHAEGHARESGAEWCKDVYDYPPKREVNKTINEKVLEQTVEDLDIPAVIRAINKL